MVIADPEHPTFARFHDRGKVHVLRDPLKVWDDTPDAWLLGRQWALCGETGAPGLQFGISEFLDNDLCADCRRAWPGDVLRLFEHPQ